MKRSAVVRSSALTGAALIGGVAVFAFRGQPSSAPPAPESDATATVVRTNLSSTALTEGTLDYSPSEPVVNRLSGTYTSLQPSASVVLPGQVLYRVDNLPVVLMSGSTPAWRDFAAGMTDGPDVGELETGLIAAGDAHGLFSAPSDHFSAATAAAVRRWQSALGLTVNGQIGLGSIVFMPAALRIDGQNVAAGSPAAPGDQPYSVSSTSRTVTVPLNPNLPTVSVGQVVSILLPSGTSTPGKVTSIGPVPPSQSNSSGGSGGGSGSSGSSGGTELVVTPDNPTATGTEPGVAVQVSLTVQSVQNVLAVPVPALLALAGGGYGLEVVTPRGTHQLVGVQTGVFAGGEVQIEGNRVSLGERVVVAQ